MLRAFLGAAAFVMTTVAADAEDYKLGDLIIHAPSAFETAKTAKAAGGYMRIENTGSSTETLVSVEADFPRVELHTTEEKDGVARMMHVGQIDIPAGEEIVLQPGGLHVMFMGISDSPFVAGASVPATLVFENAGSIDISFDVVSR